MEKTTKMVLGVAALGTAAYLYYQSTKPKNFANAAGGMVTKGKARAGIAKAKMAAKIGKKNINGTIEAHQSTFNASGKVFAPSAPSKVFNASGVFAHSAAQNVFTNLSGMHMMPNGTMMKNSMMNSKNIVGDALVSRSTNW